MKEQERKNHADILVLIVMSAIGWVLVLAISGWFALTNLGLGTHLFVPVTPTERVAAIPTDTTTPTAGPTVPTPTPVAIVISTATPSPTVIPTRTPTPTATPTPDPCKVETQDIINVLNCSRQFEILLLAVSLSNLTATLHGPGPFTVFAPSDSAFVNLSEETLNVLLADTAQLALVLQFHVVPQSLTLADITNGLTVETLMGEQVTFSVSSGSVTINGANVSTKELPASNGSVFVIDSVLLPEASQ